MENYTEPKQAWRALLAKEYEMQWTFAADRKASLLAQREAIAQAIVDLGTTPEAVRAEHIAAASVSLREWLIAEGVRRAEVAHGTSELTIFFFDDFDCCGPIAARLTRWLNANGLGCVESGCIAGLPPLARMGMRIVCARFEVDAVNGVHVSDEAGRAIVSVGRFVIAHALPAPRFAPTSRERMRTTIRRAFGTPGWPSPHDWEKWSG